MTLTVFGEILWDIFGDEKKIGGAPFNFGAHAAKLGAEARVVSAVGDDELGREAIKSARELNVNVDSIATVKEETGHCLVTLNNGTPSYNLVKNVAYDNIPVPAQELFTADALYFGTLAQRSSVSAQTLNKLFEGSYREVFFDINIRQSYYSSEMIDRSLKHTTIFKVSREEIGVLGIKGTPLEIARELKKKYPNLKLVIVTLDKDGSIVYDCINDSVIYSPIPNSTVVSTVGAGDSFSACFLVNYLNGIGLNECVRRATLLSDFVVTQLGAVPDYTYSLMLEINP